MRPDDSDEQNDDRIYRLVGQALRDRKHNGLQESANNEATEVVHAKLDALMSIFRWGFGIISSLMMIGVIAAITDHFTLKTVHETITQDHKRTEFIWYHGGFDSKYQGKNE